MTGNLRCLLICALLLNAAAPASAQQPAGRVAGRVVDAQTGLGLPGASIVVTSTEQGVLSGIDGRYLLTNVPAGVVAVRVESIGYGAKTVTDVQVPSDGVTELNITLDPQAVELDGIRVTAAAERGSVSRALDEQRNASGIVSALSSEQIARSPDGDAAAAMRRVSGVTVQDGRYVFVRGLGERYTTTALNGARIPSPEPERKVVPLDLFPSGLLQSITTSKTFTPDLPGDFSGARVNIRTREFPGSRQLTISAGGGFNTRVTGRDLFAAPTIGGEWLGASGNERALPRPVREAGDFSAPLAQEDINAMVRSFRNAWTPQRASGRGSSSLGVSLGGTDPIFGQPVSYLLSGTYSYGEEVRDDEVRARALPGANGTVLEVDRFSGSTGRTSVLWGGLANLSTLVGEHSRFFFNGNLNRSADNEARFEAGTSENHGNIPMEVQRLRFVQRTIGSAQLGAEHQLGSSRVDWSVTGSAVRRSEPDRSEFVYAQTVEGEPMRWFAASNEGAVRTFGELEENSFEAALNYRLHLGRDARHALQLGGLYRRTDRDADNRAYSISGRSLPADALALPAEQIMDGRFAQPGDSYFRVTPLSQGGSYTAEDRLVAGYAMLELGLAGRVQLITGARVEYSELDLAAQGTIGSDVFEATPSYTDLLPSLSLNVGITDDQNLRLSVSQTLARPEYRELANVQYREVLGGENVVGNPDLERTLIRNADLRWEWYPNPGEVVSLALFAKRFDAPIERVYRATSGTSIVTYVNAEEAENFGVELEMRKRLGFINESLESITVFANATVMDSRIRIGHEASSQTSTERSMVGQAPYVVNTGATWAPGAGTTSATLLYNTVGRRIVSAGEVPLPDVYEERRDVLDLSFRTTLPGGLGVKIDAKNLLDAPYELTQGDVLRESYRSGRSFAIGLTWQP
ncbi:MAG: TonB-dependent receptor [Candidatus Cloacimonetes bacterium]|jgi:outer membrane receptor for ferrienterochelin and colicin|nr:TonB-dependent receptor [Candidatus Cloacimonadota bacterium]